MAVRDGQGPPNLPVAAHLRDQPFEPKGLPTLSPGQKPPRKRKKARRKTPKKKAPRV